MMMIVMMVMGMMMMMMILHDDDSIPFTLSIHQSIYAGTNWASRQGFTDMAREFLKKRHVKPGQDTKQVTML